MASSYRGVVAPDCQPNLDAADSGCALRLMSSPGSGKWYENWLEAHASMQIMGSDDTSAGTKTRPRCLRDKVSVVFISCHSSSKDSSLAASWPWASRNAPFTLDIVF